MITVPVRILDLKRCGVIDEGELTEYQRQLGPHFAIVVGPGGQILEVVGWNGEVQRFERMAQN